jgi:hypothetical protein
LLKKKKFGFPPLGNYEQKTVDKGKDNDAAWLTGIEIGEPFPQFINSLLKTLNE